MVIVEGATHEGNARPLTDAMNAAVGAPIRTDGISANVTTAVQLTAPAAAHRDKLVPPKVGKVVLIEPVKRAGACAAGHGLAKRVGARDPRP